MHLMTHTDLTLAQHSRCVDIVVRAWRSVAQSTCQLPPFHTRHLQQPTLPHIFLTRHTRHLSADAKSTNNFSINSRTKRDSKIAPCLLHAAVSALELLELHLSSKVSAAQTRAPAASDRLQTALPAADRHPTPSQVPAPRTTRCSARVSAVARLR